MVKADLITGFLGVGKTTFIHRYLQYLKAQGQKVKIIENEFGSTDIDSIFLKDEGCEISSLAGMCMCCTGKEAFRNMLYDAANGGYDRVLIEPSGIYDVDEFFDVMLDDRIREVCEIGSILTLVDTKMDTQMTDEARYLMFSQLLAAGKVILSKTQLFDEEQEEKALKQMNEIMKEHGSSRVFGSDVCRKSWEELGNEDFREFMECGYRVFEHEMEKFSHSAVFQANMYADYCEDQEALERRIRRLMTDTSFGTVMRIKGYIQDLEKNWYELNCSPDVISIIPRQVKRGVYVVIGQNLNEKKIREEAFVPRTRKAAGR